MPEESIAEIIPHPALSELHDIRQEDTRGHDRLLNEAIKAIAQTHEERPLSTEAGQNVVQVELDPRVPDMTYRVDGRGEVFVQLPYKVTISNNKIHFSGLDYTGDSEVFDTVWYGNKGICYFRGRSEDYMPDYLGEENPEGLQKYERVIELFKDEHGTITARSGDLNPQVAKKIVDASFADKKNGIRDISSGSDFVSTTPESSAAA